MKLEHPFIQLPLSFDAQVLAREIDALGERAWRPHPQGFAGNSMLPLIAVGGDPANEAFEGPMAPTPELLDCPYLQHVFAALGATAGRSRLMRLSGQAEVTRHVDQGYYWAERVRVHVPVVTQPTVRFECGDTAINMAAGDCWIFDTWRQHRVVNAASEARIHLVIDTVGGGQFWDMVGAGKPSGVQLDVWSKRRIAPATTPVRFACERLNVPTVMSPWEMAHLFTIIFDEAAPHPALPRLRAAVARFLRTWQGLWFAHGDDAGRQPVYQAVLKPFIDEIRPVSRGVMLRNEIAWFTAVLTLVAGYAAGRLGGAPGAMA